MADARGAPLPPLAVRGETFFWKRLHGLTGVVPVGAFVVFHLWANARSLAGPAAFDAQVRRLETMPFVTWIEILVIALPLAFHSFYGVAVAARGGVNLRPYGYARNGLYVLQRLSGLVALVFIAYHYYAFRLANWIWGRPITYASVASDLRHPDIFALYAVGVVAVAFHLAYGIWNFAVDWGIAVGPRARRHLTYGSGVLFIVVSAMGLAAMAGFLR